MNLKQLDEACDLATKIRQLKSIVRYWGDDGNSLLDLLQHGYGSCVAKEDEREFIQKTLQRAQQQLAETERKFAEFCVLPEKPHDGVNADENGSSGG